MILLAILAGLGQLTFSFLDSLQYGTATPLHRAILRRQYERVERLLARGADVNARMYADLFPYTWGATPLHLASRANQQILIEQLLRAGADIDAIDDLGYSPLHAAISDHADDAVKSLLSAGARVRSPEGRGRAEYALRNQGQPLRTALQESSVTLVRELLDHGADFATDIGEDAACYADAPDLLEKIELLNSAGFLLDTTNPYQEGPLHVAARNNDVAALEFLLDHGAGIESFGGPERLTPALTAAHAGATETLKKLLERGANPKVQSIQFGSLLHTAVSMRRRETVRMLVDLGFDTRAERASDGETPLDTATRLGGAAMERMLLENTPPDAAR